jgi:hypothetical protein
MEYRTTLGMLTVLAVGGKEIKGRSMFSVNPYITFQIDHMKKKTKVSKGKGKNPKWNDLIEFEIIKGRDVLNGKVMGKEISEDEFIGDIKVDLKPIFQKGYAEIWVPVIHPHKNRHKGDVFLKLQYKPTVREPAYPPPRSSPMGGPAPMGGPIPGPAPGPSGGPAPMGPPVRSPIRPQLQRSATAPIPGVQPPVRTGSAGPGARPIVIPPRQGGPVPSPINIPPRGNPGVRPYPSPSQQRPGVRPVVVQGTPPIPQRAPSTPGMRPVNSPRVQPRSPMVAPMGGQMGGPMGGPMGPPPNGPNGPVIPQRMRPPLGPRPT